MRTIVAITLSISLAHAGEIESAYFAETLRDPMELAVAPGGNLIVIEREGRLLRVHPATGGVFEIGNVPVTALRSSDSKSAWAKEDGLLGLALDPSFATNQRLYLYYSHPEKLLNRLSRFQLKDGKLDLTSESVLLDVATDRRDTVCHQGGSLTFGPGGLLYLSTGDNTNPFESDGCAPLDDREGHEHTNAMRSAGNTNDLRGKILRIRPTETGYEIPTGNLFTPGTAKTRPEIYIMGCRNPFRISVDPKTNILYWGEVGPDARSESTNGPRGHDEVNQAKAAGNFGWPFVIADNKPYPIVDFTTHTPGIMTDPAAPKNPSRLNTGLASLPPAQKAFIWYPYAKSEEFPAIGEGGRNAMAGPVFYYNSNRPYNLLGKTEDHTLLTYDWMRGKIWKASLGTHDQLVKLEHVFAREQRLDGRLLRRRCLLHDGNFVLLGQVIDHHVEHEAVELGLGQGIGAFHLDRVLGRQHEERFGQHVTHTGGRHLMFLHGFEQRRLRLGRRAVDLVGEDDVREHRSGNERQLPAFRRVLKNLGTRDVGGHQVRRELHALELQVKDLRQRFHEQRLGEAGRTRDEAMPAGKERDEDLLHDFLLAHDHLAEFLLNLDVAGAQLFDQCRFDGGRRGWLGGRRDRRRCGGSFDLRHGWRGAGGSGDGGNRRRFGGFDGRVHHWVMAKKIMLMPSG